MSQGETQRENEKKNFRELFRTEILKYQKSQMMDCSFRIGEENVSLNCGIKLMNWMKWRNWKIIAEKFGKLGYLAYVWNFNICWGFKLRNITNNSRIFWFTFIKKSAIFFRQWSDIYGGISNWSHPNSKIYSIFTYHFPSTALHFFEWVVRMQL